MAENKEELWICLGCFGRTDASFVSCRPVENKILNIHKNLNDYEQIMSYFDTLRLFDRPLFDINAIRHFVYNIKNKYMQNYKPLWNEQTFGLIEKFIVSHKACGVYIKLALIDSNAKEQQEEEASNAPEVIEVKGEDKPDGSVGLRLIRGRR